MTLAQSRRSQRLDLFAGQHRQRLHCPQRCPAARAAGQQAQVTARAVRHGTRRQAVGPHGASTTASPSVPSVSTAHAPPLTPGPGNPGPGTGAKTTDSAPTANASSRSP